MKLIYRKELRASTADTDYLEQCMTFLDNSLTELGIDRRLSLRAQLLSEEMIAKLAQNAASPVPIRVRVEKLLGDASITLKASGSSFDPYSEDTSLLGELEEGEAENAIRSILLRSNGERFKYSHRNGINRVRIMAGQAERSNLRAALMALVLGIVVGLGGKLLPGAVMNGVCDYLLSPAQTMFMNALKIIIGPVVFFSIVTCFSQFRELSELGRIGFRVLSMYCVTTVIAVLLAIGMFLVCQPGTWGAALGAQLDTVAVEVDPNAEMSLLDTIVNIVPSNFVRPFLEADTLQIIFLAILCGISVNMIGNYSGVLIELFEACNSLFLAITSMITRLIPVAVFCSVVLMFHNTGLNSMLMVLGAFGTQVASILLMILVYGLLLAAICRLNPLQFFRNIREGMITSFTLCSSSAAMPTNMRICTEKLGISPKVSNFSIPLGATVNMDGTSIFLVSSALFLAKLYAVEITPGMMVSLCVTVVLLSLGAPGVPGSGIVCLGVVLTQLGVPIQAIGIIMTVNSFLDMFVTMSNTTGDMAVSTIAAKSEGLLNEEVYLAKD